MEVREHKLFKYLSRTTLSVSTNISQRSDTSSLKKTILTLRVRRHKLNIYVYISVTETQVKVDSYYIPFDIAVVKIIYIAIGNTVVPLFNVNYGRICTSMICYVNFS